jgi:NAD(P)-dependent dehydrogenase (short-subunit alcohol dehydrogenase family)
MFRMERGQTDPMEMSFPTFGLAGRRALVTGAGRGIGLAAARALAHAGADVTLASRTDSELQAAVDAIRSQGGKASALAVDVTRLADFRQAVAGMSPFDVLVNNAGGNRPQPFVDVTEENFDFLSTLNVKAAFFVAQTIARGMIEAGKPGSIINMSSQMGHVGGSNRTVYCVTKHAIEGLTKAMAIELGPHGVRVNTLCPTFIKTPMTKAFLQDPEFVRNTVSKIKLGRIGQVDDLLGAIVFLASDASSFMTGSALMVDGGWTAE